MDLGLERITHVLKALENPQDKVPVVHLAGTNGKGSTCTYLARLLGGPGWGERRVGQFTSPHFLEPRDAIRINGIPIPPGQYQELHERLMTSTEGGEALTSFEQETAVAFLYFVAMEVDVALIECGLGGALDATNVCVQPLLCILTSISLDHEAILGGTILEITRAKVGILRPDVPVVLAHQEEATREVVEGVVRGRAGALGCPLYLAPDQFKDGKGPVPCPLPGKAQEGNLSTALTALSLLPSSLTPDMSPDRTRRALLGMRWAGRMDVQSLPPLPAPVLMDGAHNPAGAHALRQALGEEEPIGWILGLSQGKDVDGMLRELLRPGDRAILLGFSIPDGMPWCRCMDPRDVESRIVSILPSLPTRVFPTKNEKDGMAGREERESLVHQALTHASSSFVSHRPVICGSLYLLADVYRTLGLEAFSPTE
ncbi:Mur ligase [Piptocephalis cylindrospora]|uniref:Dihydrofolate synthetase n=1 Tax=Piptocephalis cylindrospora TaxID=1907219 RepID=A0A4V1IXP6_9FUNG|nr:Mur ligase [Piptocephalis cylindrospora]|eukprot:RKP11789.1 Mur ligase [Piptocephalis cylindrospora]